MPPDSTHSRHAMTFWFSQILQNQKKRLFVGLLLAWLTAASAIGLLALSGWLITATAIAGLSIAAGSVMMLDIFRPGGGIRFFALSRTAGRYFERLHNHDLVLRVIAGFRNSLFSGLLALPVHELRQTRDSEWLSRLTADLDNLDSIVLKLLLPPVTAVVTVLLMALFIGFFWQWLGLLFALSTLIVGIMYFSWFTFRTSAISECYASQINQARQLTIEHLQGQLELQAAHLQGTHQTSLLAMLNQVGESHARLLQHIANGQLAVNLCHGLLLTGVALLSLWGYQSELFSGPVAVMLFLAVFGLAEVLQSLPAYLGQWGKTHYAARRLQPLAEHKPLPSQAIAELERISMMVAGHPKISSSMDSPIAFELLPQQYLLISGRSGSGKSTLANILTGLEFPDSFLTPYQMLINGVPLQPEQVQAWHNQIGYLTQQNSIIAATLYSNLTLGLDDIDDNRLWHVLSLVELDEWAKQLPKGLHSWLGDTGSQLSGGQARRVCLARLLLRNPKLILLDEPFNGMDTQMAERIWQRIYPLWQDKMLIVLMHERPEYFPEVDNEKLFEIYLD